VGVTVGSLVAAILTSVFNTIGRRILERDGFLHPHPTTKKARGGVTKMIIEFFSHLKDFSIEFWFIAILNFTFFCLLAFVGFSTVYFSSKYGKLNFAPLGKKHLLAITITLNRLFLCICWPTDKCYQLGIDVSFNPRWDHGGLYRAKALFDNSRD